MNIIKALFYKPRTEHRTDNLLTRMDEQIEQWEKEKAYFRNISENINKEFKDVVSRYDEIVGRY